jgi:hypothetical protein
MKKFYLVLFAGVLITAFSMPAVAADIKFFGSYYAIGQWASNYSLTNDASGKDNASRGTYGQRLRVSTVYQVADGLKLTTSFDALERAWGQENSIGTPNPSNTYPAAAPATGLFGSGTGVNVENNISWERAFVTFNLGPGFFDVGYMSDGWWSPIAFGNTSGGAGPIIRYTALFGPVTLSAYWEKCRETQFDPAVYEPGDWDRYALQGAYKWKSGQAGLQLLWEKYEASKPEQYDIWNTLYNVPFAAKMDYYEISPFFQAKLSVVDLEGKLYWTLGKFKPTAGGNDLDIDGFSAYLNGKVNIGPAYIGGMFTYIKGQDPNDVNHATLSHGGGRDWDPTLMLGNDKFAKWLGGRYAKTIGWGTPSGGLAFRGGWNEQNVWIYQGYAGFKPIPKLELRAAFSYLNQDKELNGYVNDHIGDELDITATYKIYPNLEYTVGFGYLWAGDFFKGTSANADIKDCYLLMHQIVMTF